MKKIVLLVTMVLTCLTLNAQKNDTTYHAWGRSVGNIVIIDDVTAPQNADTAYLTPFVRLDCGVYYPIFILSNGACFVYKVDAETGKPFKVILPRETSEYIRHRMANEYFGKQSIEGKPIKEK